MRVMKTVGKELKRKGVTMKRYYNNFPLCCPSRSTILTGQYAHNHQVLSNSAARRRLRRLQRAARRQLPAALAAGRPATGPPTSASS